MVVALGFVAGCGGGSTSAPTADPVPATNGGAEEAPDANPEGESGGGEGGGDGEVEAG